MDYYTRYAPELAWDIAPTPIGKSDRVYRVPGADGLVVASTKHPKESWELIKFFLGGYVQTDKARSRLEVPIYRPTLLDTSWMQAPPRSMWVISGLINRSVTPKLFLGANEAASAISKALNPAFKGTMSLEAAIAEAQRLGQAALDQARK